MEIKTWGKLTSLLRRREKCFSGLLATKEPLVVSWRTSITLLEKFPKLKNVINNISYF